MSEIKSEKKIWEGLCPDRKIDKRIFVWVVKMMGLFPTFPKHGRVFDNDVVSTWLITSVYINQGTDKSTPGQKPTY